MINCLGDTTRPGSHLRDAISISYWTHSIDRLPVVGHLPGHLRRLNGMKAQGGVMEQLHSWSPVKWNEGSRPPCTSTIAARLILASPFRFRCTRRRHSLVENFVRTRPPRIALERTTTTLRSIGGSTTYCSLQQNKWLKTTAVTLLPYLYQIMTFTRPHRTFDTCFATGGYRMQISVTSRYGKLRITSSHDSQLD